MCLSVASVCWRLLFLIRTFSLDYLSLFLRSLFLVCLIRLHFLWHCFALLLSAVCSLFVCLLLALFCFAWVSIHKLVLGHLCLSNDTLFQFVFLFLCFYWFFDFGRFCVRWEPKRPKLPNPVFLVCCGRRRLPFVLEGFWVCSWSVSWFCYWMNTKTFTFIAFVSASFVFVVWLFWTDLVKISVAKPSFFVLVLFISFQNASLLYL